MVAHPLRPVVVVLSLAALAPALGCPVTPECGGLSTEVPDVGDGRGQAERADGEPFDEDASWAPGSNASVTIGLLDMIVAKDATGTDLDTLLEDGALPICVPLADRSDSSGNAVYNESPGFVSDAAHTGNVFILEKDGDFLVGRFQVDLVNSGSAQTLSFDDGVFRARRR
jgi:hypothetical protein